MSALALIAASPVHARPGQGAPHAVWAVPRAVLGPSVTVPVSANLGTTKPGTTVTVNLGSVTVSNVTTRGWTATVSATPLKTGAGTAAQTIPADKLSYWSGPLVSKTGTGTWTPGQPAAANAQDLNTPRTSFSYSTIVGTSSSVTFSPKLVVSVPSTAVAGTYTGKVTHSVA
ncbi:hypothetical protein [Streptomyces boluensis]|uniref:WxL domain-containing protein n=1 Tax=Streptomyces boluensis TaxID=1775135 RepID=A0A964UTM1_9ACTN|nr:hypothetical protein [Streptomyces boluensis]NBE54507.1 hypothetical protein [Streptomyces boluensis]